MIPSRLRSLWDGIKSSIWFTPAFTILMFVAGAILVAWLDRTVVSQWDGITLYGGRADGARALLSTVAASMLSLAVLVFTVTLIVLQLASAQLGPRVLALFLSDRWTQVAMGVFLGTFGYALMGLWLTISSVSPETGYVPVLMVSVTLPLVALSIIVFINYVHRVSQSIRVETVARTIAHQTIDALESLEELPDGWKAESVSHSSIQKAGRRLPLRPAKVCAPRSGLVTSIVIGILAEYARNHGAVVRILVPVGKFVTVGMPVAEVLVEPDVELSADKVLKGIIISNERAVARDPVFGVDQLVDIVLRALSPSVNGPGAAIVVIDRLHEILHKVGSMELYGPLLIDESGDARLIIPQLGWDGWVATALRPVIDNGEDSVQVCHRLLRMLHDLRDTLPESRGVVLDQYLIELEELTLKHSAYVEWRGADSSSV